MTGSLPIASASTPATRNRFAIDKYGKTAAQRLGDITDGSGRHGQFITGGDHDDGAVPFELAGLAGMAKHGLQTSTHLGLQVVFDTHLVDQGQLRFQPVNMVFL